MNKCDIIKIKVIKCNGTRMYLRVTFKSTKLLFILSFRRFNIYVSKTEKFFKIKLFN